MATNLNSQNMPVLTAPPTSGQGTIPQTTITKTPTSTVYHTLAGDIGMSQLNAPTVPPAGSPAVVSSSLASSNKDAYGNIITQNQNDVNLQTQNKITSSTTAKSDAQLKTEQDALAKTNADKLALDQGKLALENKKVDILGTSDENKSYSSGDMSPEAVAWREANGMASQNNYLLMPGKSAIYDANNNLTGYKLTDGRTIDTTGKLITPGTPATPVTEADSYATETAANKAKLAQTAQDFNNATQKLQNGTFPLNPLQQAQLDALSRDFDELIKTQERANAVQEGVVKETGVLRSEYTPEMEAGNVASVVKANIDKIAALDMKKRGALAQMQAGFESDNYKLMEASYKTLTDATKDQQKFLDDSHKAITDALQKQKDDEYKREQDKIKNDLESSKFTWQQKKDKADLAIQQGKLDLDTAKASLDTSITNLLGTSSPVTQNPDGTYDTTTQDALLAQFPPNEAAIIKAVGTYKMDLSKVTSLAGGKREKLAAEVALVYPEYRAQNYQANLQYTKGLANTTITSPGGIINSANKMLNHLTEFVDYTSTLPNAYPVEVDIPYTNIKLGNPTLSAIGSAVSPRIRENLASAKTAAIGVKDELAKFFKGTGVADVATMQDWERRINPYATTAELKGTAQAAIDLLQGQLLPMMDQYKQTMGTEPPEGLFIKEDTKKNLSDLKNQGYRVDIPGVYYTNIDSYYKYGMGSQESLTKAQNDLKAAGLPVTVENALQWAQMNNY